MSDKITIEIHGFEKTIQQLRNTVSTGDPGLETDTMTFIEGAAPEAMFLDHFQIVLTGYCCIRESGVSKGNPVRIL